MADQRVTDLPAINAADDADVIYLIDTSDTTDDPAGTSKYITKADFVAGIGGGGGGGLIEDAPGVVDNGFGYLELTAATYNDARAILQSHQATNIPELEIYVYATDNAVTNDPSYGAWSLVGINAYPVVFDDLDFATNGASLRIHGCSNIEIGGTMPGTSGNFEQITLTNSNIKMGWNSTTAWLAATDPNDANYDTPYISLTDSSTMNCYDSPYCNGILLEGGAKWTQENNIYVTGADFDIRDGSHMITRYGILSYSSLTISLNNGSSMHDTGCSLSGTTQATDDITVYSYAGSRYSSYGHTLNGGTSSLSHTNNTVNIPEAGAEIYIASIV